MDSVPHLELPMRVVGGQYAQREQDTDAEVADAIRVLVSFMRGDRIEDPEFGVDDPSFQTQPIDTDDIYSAIHEYEPRAQVDITTHDQPDGSTTVSIKMAQPTSDDLPTEA